MKFGVISDTHGLLRPEAVAALSGVDRILHLGDIGPQSILDRLAEIAPVTAIRGNVDHSGPTSRLPETEVVLVENSPDDSLYLYLLHDLHALHLDPAAAKFAAVLHGHSHTPNYHTKKGVLYFNPGSAGPRRFHLPVTVGLLTIDDKGKIAPEIVYLPAS
jgi:putative phosphoesterase